MSDQLKQQITELADATGGVSQDALDEKADDSAVVHKTGNETIGGIKTFPLSPIVPAPTTANQAANRQFVLDNTGAAPNMNVLKWVARFTHEDVSDEDNFSHLNKEFHGNFYAGPHGVVGQKFGNRALGWLAAAEYGAEYLAVMGPGGAHPGGLGGYDGGSLIDNRIGVIGNFTDYDGYSTQGQFDSGVERYRIGSWLSVLVVFWLPWWFVYVKGVPVKRGKGNGGVDLTESGIAVDYDADIIIGHGNHSKFAGLGSNVLFWLEDAPFQPGSEQTAPIRPHMNPMPFRRKIADSTILPATSNWDIGANPGGHYIPNYGQGMEIDGRILVNPAVPANGQMFANYANDNVNYPKSFYPQYELANVFENPESDLTVTPAPSLLVNELFKRADVTWQHPNSTTDGTNSQLLGLGSTDPSGSLGAVPWQRSSKYGITAGGGAGEGEYGGMFSAAQDDAEFPFIQVGVSNHRAFFRNGGNHTPYWEAWICYDAATGTGLQIAEHNGTLSFKLIINNGAQVVSLTDDVSGLGYVQVSANGKTQYEPSMAFNSLEGSHGKARLYINGVLGITHTFGATSWTKGDGVGVRMTDGMCRCSFVKVATSV